MALLSRFVQAKQAKVLGVSSFSPSQLEALRSCPTPVPAPAVLADMRFSVGNYIDKDRMQFSINHFDKAQATAYKAALSDMLGELKEMFASASK